MQTVHRSTAVCAIRRGHFLLLHACACVVHQHLLPAILTLSVCAARAPQRACEEKVLMATAQCHTRLAALR